MSLPPPKASIYLGQPNPRSLFNTKQIRSAFISKVYTLLFLQLLVATILIAWFALHKPTKDYMIQYGAPYLYGAFGLFLVTYMVLVCVESARRSFPWNLILMGLITLSYGLIAAIFSARFQTVTVLCAFGATAFATIVVALLARYSPFDMTTCGCGLCILGLIHLIVSITLMLILVPMGYGTTASYLIAGSGAFLVSLYMMFDMQLIMGGRSCELSPEEYILGATLLYIDILQLFQYMLILFGGRNG